jgi:hypothetical protein
MNCGLEEALSEIVTVPAALPELCGLKITLISHRAPAATLLPQVLDWRNGPATLSAEIDKAADPVLVRVTLCGALVVPTS